MGVMIIYKEGDDIEKIVKEESMEVLRVLGVVQEVMVIMQILIE